MWILAEVTCFCWFRYSSSLYCRQRGVVISPARSPGGLRGSSKHSSDLLCCVVAQHRRSQLALLHILSVYAEHGAQRHEGCHSRCFQKRERNPEKLVPHYLNAWTAVANKTAGAPAGGAGFGATGAGDRRHIESCWVDAPLCVWGSHLPWSSFWAALVPCTGRTHFPERRPGPVQRETPAWPWKEDKRRSSHQQLLKHLPGPWNSESHPAAAGWALSRGRGLADSAPPGSNWQHVTGISCLLPSGVNPACRHALADTFQPPSGPA